MLTSGHANEQHNYINALLPHTKSLKKPKQQLHRVRHKKELQLSKSILFQGKVPRHQFCYLEEVATKL